MIGKGHPEFSTKRQQDAQEFFLHVINILEVLFYYFDEFDIWENKITLLSNYVLVILWMKSWYSCFVGFFKISFLFLLCISFFLRIKIDIFIECDIKKNFSKLNTLCICLFLMFVNHQHFHFQVLTYVQSTLSMILCIC